MIRRNKRLMSSLMALSIVLSGIYFPSISASAAEIDNVSLNRISGQDRYETSAKVAEIGWSKADYAVIANGESLADALCASPLAKKYDAPVLLTQKDGVNATVLQTLKKLGVKNVFIIGGEGVVSNSVINNLKENGIASVERIAGEDRYETSVKVAERVGNNENVVVAYGEGFADAVSIAPIAAYKGIPVIFTNKDSLSKPLQDYLKGKNIKTSYIIGGTGVVSEAVKENLPNSLRIAGQDRYETNRNVIKEFGELDFSNLYFAVGSGDKVSDFADALASSALASKSGSPIVITEKNLREETKNLVKENMRIDSKLTVVGGEAIVSSESFKDMNGFKDFSKDTEFKENTEFKQNIKITEKNTFLKNIKTPYSLYISGDNVTLENAEIGGTLYVDPGEKGVSNIKNVKAGKVVILSGAQESNHLDGVEAGKLTVKPKNPSNNPRIEIKGQTSIGSTIVQAAAILDVKTGTFGNVEVTKNNEKTNLVELRGNFDKPITITGDARLKTSETTKVSKIVIAPKNNETIVLDGVYDFVEIVKGAKVEIAAGAKITGKLIVASDAEVKADKTAEVNKVEISTADKNSKVVLDGNFKEVEVAKEAKVVVASGNANIKADVKVDIDVAKEANVALKGEASNVNVKGEGKVQNGGDVVKENNAANLPDNSSADSSSSESNEEQNIYGQKSNAKWIDKNMFNTGRFNVFPAGITVRELLSGIVVSPMATAKVIGADGKEVNPEELVLEEMKIKVTAEDGSCQNWNICFKQSMAMCPGVLDLQFKDEDNSIDKVSGVIKFKGTDNEDQISKYYYSIKSVVDENGRFDEKIIKSGFIDKNDTKEYSQLVSFNNSPALTLEVKGIGNDNGVLGERKMDIYSSPVDMELPSLQGITINDYNDLDNNPGRLKGEISFKGADDESNIYMYEMAIKMYTDKDAEGNYRTSSWSTYYVKADGRGVYNLNDIFKYDILVTQNVLGAGKVEIKVSPKNKSGIGADGKQYEFYDFEAPGTCVSKGIIDLPQVKVNVGKPIIEKSLNNPYEIKVANVIPGSKVCLYKYNLDTAQYEIVKYSSGINLFADVFGQIPVATINYQQPGRYKVKQIINGEESELSDEFILQPGKLNTITIGSKITALNAVENADINLVNEQDGSIVVSKKVVLTQSPTEGIKTDVTFDNLPLGRYYLVQVFNGIESEASEVVTINHPDEVTTPGAISVSNK